MVHACIVLDKPDWTLTEIHFLLSLEKTKCSTIQVLFCLLTCFTNYSSIFLFNVNLFTPSANLVLVWRCTKNLFLWMHFDLIWLTFLFFVTALDWSYLSLTDRRGTPQARPLSVATYRQTDLAWSKSHRLSGSAEHSQVITSCVEFETMPWILSLTTLG